MVKNNRYHEILEYVTTRYGGVDEDGNQDNQMNGNAPEPDMGMGAGADPNMGGSADANMGGAPAPDMGMDGGAADTNMGGGTDPNMGGAPAPDMGMDGGADANMGGGANGFNPDMGGTDTSVDPSQMDGSDSNVSQMEDGDEVIDVDDLVDSQDETENKIDKLSHKFEKLLKMIDTFSEKIDNNDKGIEDLKAEIEKRNPTDLEKMSLRAKKSYPFDSSIENYWNNDAPDNYSTEDDANGINDKKYNITKSDIDSISDYTNISKEMREKNMSLNDIFGF